MHPIPIPIEPFQGFRSPTYTPVPDELFDDLMSTLSGAGLKVLLYIVRRTFGFKKADVDHSPRLKPGDSWADHRSPSELGESYTVMSWPEATSTSVPSRRPCGRA